MCYLLASEEKHGGHFTVRFDLWLEVITARQLFEDIVEIEIFCFGTEGYSEVQSKIFRFSTMPEIN